MTTLGWHQADQELRLRATRTLILNTLGDDPDLRVSEVPSAYNDRLTFLVEHDDGRQGAWCLAVEPVDSIQRRRH